MSLSRTRGPLGLKAQREAPDHDRLARIHELPCVVCLVHGLVQTSPTQAHHCIHGRHGTRRSPDSMAIPLCEGHHQGLMDTSKVALHREPERWKALYGLDTDYLELTNKLLAGMAERTS